MKRFARSLTIALTLVLPVSGQCADAGHGKSAVNGSQPHPVAETPQQPSYLSGKVVEIMNTPEYTYLNIEKKSGEKQWVAVPSMKVKVGDDVELSPGNEMGKFTSKTLKRTFDSIIFSGGPINIDGKRNDEAIKKKAHEGIVTGEKKGADGAVENVRVEKATGPNAYTVEELYRKSGELAGMDVVVKAGVVKVSAGIMNKNWIHLRDGSGDAAKGTHNLVVTSQDLPKAGDVVTVSGTLAKEKDFGGGYKYEVIVENARVNP
ncbi:MAG: OB-fold tRNA/helicase-type nucleic acid binding [Geobacteraceae bacterium]|nr:MAG: OB-fold tRNA/helicase-type nucleic acid binding [Geobacteraceae bacterium]